MKKLVSLSLSLLVLVPPQAMAADFLDGVIGRALEEAAQGRVRNAQDAVRALTEASTGAAPAAAAGAAPARGKRKTLRHGEIFYPDYIADYWSRAGAAGSGDDASSNAPGHVNRKLVLGGDQRQAGAPEMRRKLEAIQARILAHPALADIRGASLTTGGGLRREQVGPAGSVIAARLSVNAYTIFLDNPRTRQLADGTYFTPGNEADHLEIEFNNPGVLRDREPLDTYNGMILFPRSSGYMLLVANTDRPVMLQDGRRQVVNPQLLDPARAPADIQFMTIYVGAPSSTWSDIARGRQKPASGVGRLIGVMFNVDWAGLLREVN